MSHTDADISAIIADLECENRLLRARNERQTASDVDDMAERVMSWADATFPDRTDASMFLKMYEEISEVIRSDGHRLEVADLFILILDYAKRKGIDIRDAVDEKLEINRKRDWKLNANGTMSHKDK